MAASTTFASHHAAAGWCFSRSKRVLDLSVASLLLAAAAPLMLLIAAAVRITSPGPVLFRQSRLGQHGRPFDLLKFRTMRNALSEGALLTSRGDSRITALGRRLRAWKLDELPQLINVLRGDMSLVGPRPDLESFWEQTDAESRRVLALKPGITGAASLVFREEEELLAEVPTESRHIFYVTHLLPQKAAIDLSYAASANFRSDCMLMVRTAFKVLLPSQATPRTGKTR
jgi:lipopolysaccharide/colanic/teichoic acid biosynthesis glycosyltransferase